MKRCPQCGQTYSDDTLNFCLSDGGALVFMADSSFEETVVIPSPFFQQTSTPIRRGVKPVFAYLSFGLLALLVGGGLVMWIKSDSGGTSVAKNDALIPTEQKVGASNDKTVDLKQEQDALDKERQRLDDERRKLDARKSVTPVATSPQVARSSGTWFVVCGSYAKHESEKANQRLRYIQGLGYEASIVDTNNYPGLKDGLYAVVVGPYSKADARSLMGRMKSAVPDAYIKSGW